MRTKYLDLISQTYEFPQEQFEVVDNELHFNEVPLMDIIKQYGTPLKITYLPKISEYTTCAPLVQCRNRKGGLQRGVPLLLLHQKLPLRVCAFGSA